MIKDHIWYNVTEDKLFIVPFTPLNYTLKDLFFFNIKFLDYCIYVDEL